MAKKNHTVEQIIGKIGLDRSRASEYLGTRKKLRKAEKKEFLTNETP